MPAAAVSHDDDGDASAAAGDQLCWVGVEEVQRDTVPSRCFVRGAVFLGSEGSECVLSVITLEYR